MLIIQNIVAYKTLKPKYREKILYNYEKYQEGINNVLIDFWGSKVGMYMIKLLQNSDFDSIVKASLFFEKSAKKQIFRKRPFYTIKNIFRFLIEKFYQIVICPKSRRRHIAVEAPDGTGKTTFINKLISELSFFYICGPERFNIHHFRPSFLPNLGAAGEKAGIMKQDKNFTNPHRAKPVGKLSSFLRMTYYWLDYVLGVPFLLRKESQYGEYTIFDRYIYDFLVDPHRSRINLPYWLRKFYVKTVSTPQIIFVLSASPIVVFKRKQELTLEEISRQMNEFKKLFNLSENCVEIDANLLPDEMVKVAINIIMNKYMKKII